MGTSRRKYVSPLMRAGQRTAIIAAMRRIDPEDRCDHDFLPDECPICSDEELAYPEFAALAELPEEALIPGDLVGVPFS
jgi:hypothetical protein